MSMIYIIRHGKTELNKANVLQGRSDYPLNEEGISQAKRAACGMSGIDFSNVFSSPLKRAVQTAELVAPGIKAVIDERLIEMDYGPYEGSDLRDPSPEIRRFFSDWREYGLGRLDEWVNIETTYRALIKRVWRGVEFYDHWVAEGPETY